MDISHLSRYLGLLADTLKMIFLIPETKIEDFLSKIKIMTDSESMVKRELALVVGLLMSFFRALGPIVRLMTRAMYACVHEGNKDWDSQVKILLRAKAEARFCV